jgi:predicted nucleic acid-binding Zn ribbon protein
VTSKVCRACEWQKAVTHNSIAWCADHMPPVRQGRVKEWYTPEPMFRNVSELFDALDAAAARKASK